jgi:hypothetical protein
MKNRIQRTVMVLSLALLAVHPAITRTGPLPPATMERMATLQRTVLVTQ